MGQQQLLLLVLATVIVGLATVAGIQAFEQGSARANQDALTQTAVKIASDAQAQIKEPEQFGGYGGDLSSSTGITLSEMGYDATTSASDLSGTGNDSGVYETANGECAIGSSSVAPSSGAAASDPTGTVYVSCASGDNHVVVGIETVDSDGINTNAVSTAS